MRAGIFVYGMAAIATGIINLIWGGFEGGHEPIQAFGGHIPGREMFAYAVAIWLVVGGAAILWRRSARLGAVMLAIVYSIFAVFWLPRLATASHVLGFRTPVFVGVLDGVCQQLILVAAAVVVYVSLSRRGSSWPQGATFFARLILGLSSLDFGLAHLMGMRWVAPLVSHWLPPSQNFWALLTGIAFVLAGFAILLGVLDVLAARLLALMLLVFSALALAPLLVASPHSQAAWGGNAYNLAAVGAAWILAQWLLGARRSRDANMESSA